MTHPNQDPRLSQLIHALPNEKQERYKSVIAGEHTKLLCKIGEGVKKRIDRANELKEYIDNPIRFQGGRQWTRGEKKLLNDSAVKNYAAIQSSKIEIAQSSKIIEDHLNESSQYWSELDKKAQEIENTIKEIDKHLEDYKEKLQFIDEAEDPTPEEKKWAEEARKQVILLNEQKTNLNIGLTEIRQLQSRLKNVENTITEDLKNMFGNAEKPPKPPQSQQSAEAINQEMAKLKEDLTSFSSTLGTIASKASNLFSSLFSSCKTLFSEVSSLLKGAKGMLQASSDLLNSCPIRAPSLSCSSD